MSVAFLPMGELEWPGLRGRDETVRAQLRVIQGEGDGPGEKVAAGHVPTSTGPYSSRTRVRQVRQLGHAEEGGISLLGAGPALVHPGTVCPGTPASSS